MSRLSEYSSLLQSLLMTQDHELSGSRCNTRELGRHHDDNNADLSRKQYIYYIQSQIDKKILLRYGDWYAIIVVMILIYDLEPMPYIQF